MKKNILPALLLFIFSFNSLQAQFAAVSAGFVPGFSVIFEDQFGPDALGDFPAKWNSSSDGELVTIDGFSEKWCRIMQPTSVSPVLKKSLPEHFTVEFDLYLKDVEGVAPVVMFGFMPLSKVTGNQAFQKNLFVRLNRYNKSGQTEIVYGKNNMQTGVKTNASLEGFIDRSVRVSIAVNKNRFRVFLDDKKVLDMPDFFSPEYRNNFFIASYIVMPASSEGVYFSNVRIASADPDARSLLVKQLLEKGSVVTSDIQFNNNTYEMLPESLPLVDQLGYTLLTTPDMNIEINSYRDSLGIESFQATDGNNMQADESILQKLENLKNYVVQKFKIDKERIITNIKPGLQSSQEKAKTKVTDIKKQFLEIVKL